MMPRLSRNEIERLQHQLSNWQTPAEMAKLVEDINNRLGSVDFLTQGGLAFLRDAWTAAEFGQIRQAKKARLVAENWPDFDLNINDRIEKFEAVEADDPTRKRGDEYRNDTGEVEFDPVENWIARAQQAPAWLGAACKKKAEKHYCAGSSLVIYLNLSEYGIRQEQIENCLTSATAAVKDSFDKVWVLWKKRAYLVWEFGEARPLVE